MVLDVGKVGYGLMLFTWTPTPKSQDEFNAALKEVLDKRGYSEPLFLNGGEFYGTTDRYLNLKRIGAFFEAYPQYADHVIVSIKGGLSDSFMPDASPENLKKSIDATNKYLEPLYKARSKLPAKLDIYCLARQDARYSVEESMKTLVKFVESGEIGSICLSEVSAASIERAAKVHPLSAVELEFSLWSREPESNGVFSTLKKLGIPAICYSPLAKGLFAGVTTSDLPEGDIRHHFDRFQGENWEHNKQLVQELQKLSSKLSITPAQTALSWITTLSGTEGYPQLIPIPGSSKGSRQLENLSVKELPAADMKELHDFLSGFQVKGLRYNAAMEGTLEK